jgi:tetratricopeptide (TPR) repeat protein
MSQTDKTPAEELKEIPAEEEKGTSSGPELSARPNGAALPAVVKERQKIATWSRRGTSSVKPSNAPQVPALLPPPLPAPYMAAPAAESAPPDNIGAPFVEEIASSFAAQEQADREQEKEKLKQTEPKQAAQEQPDAPDKRLAQALSRVIAMFREHPIRYELKIGLAVVAICGAGLMLKQIVPEQPSPLGEKPPAGKIERAVASIEPPAAQNPEPQSFTPISVPVPDSIPSPAEPNPAPTPVESAPSPKDARDDAVEDSLHNLHSPAPASDVIAIASPPPSDTVEAAPQPNSPVAEQPRQEAKPASAKEAKPADAKDLDAAEVGFKAALAHGKATKDKQLIATASGELGAILYKRGELDAAEAALRQSLGLYEELSPTDDALKEGTARISNALGQLYRDRGQFDKAEKMYNKAVAIDKAMGRDADLANDYNNLGLLYQARKKPDLAEQAYVEALRIQKKLQSNEGIASSYANLGQVHFSSGDLDRAVDMFKKAIAVEDAGRLRRGIAMDYSNLGVVYAKRRDFANACACWRKARRMLQDAGMKTELARVQRALRAEPCSQYSEATPLELR